MSTTPPGLLLLTPRVTTLTANEVFAPCISSSHIIGPGNSWECLFEPGLVSTAVDPANRPSVMTLRDRFNVVSLLITPP
jgi:hypothetical protein